MLALVTCDEHLPVFIHLLYINLTFQTVQSFKDPILFFSKHSPQILQPVVSR